MTAPSPAPTALLTTTTPRLRTGDLVLAYGMRVRLGRRQDFPCQERDRHGVPRWPAIVRFDGTVENVDEVNARGVVPAGMRGPSGDDWSVQGNEHRTWPVLERGPVA